MKEDAGAVYTIAHAGRMDTEQFNVLMKVRDLFPRVSTVDVSVMDIGWKSRIVVVDQFRSVISCSDQTAIFIYHYISPHSNMDIAAYWHPVLPAQLQIPDAGGLKIRRDRIMITIETLRHFL